MWNLSFPRSPDLRPGIKPTPLAMEVQSLNPVDHEGTPETPVSPLIFCSYHYLCNLDTTLETLRKLKKQPTHSWILLSEILLPLGPGVLLGHQKVF